MEQQCHPMAGHVHFVSNCSQPNREKSFTHKNWKQNCLLPAYAGIWPLLSPPCFLNDGYTSNKSILRNGNCLKTKLTACTGYQTLKDKNGFTWIYKWRRWIFPPFSFVKGSNGQQFCRLNPASQRYWLSLFLFSNKSKHTLLETLEKGQHFLWERENGL